MDLHDTHGHLQASDFAADLDSVVARARAAGVVRVLAVAEDLEDCHRVLGLADRLPAFVAPALGVHPDRAALVTDAEVADVLALCRTEADRLAALGEIGLDFRPCWDERSRARQREVFSAFARLGAELGLPLSVHSRSAGHHAVTLLEEHGCPAACLHAFDGRAAHALRGAALGLVFSIPPSVVRSPAKQELARRLPATGLLLESDSPVLGPDPAVRNEPANIRVALGEIARVRGQDEAALAEVIAANVARIFPRLS